MEGLLQPGEKINTLLNNELTVTELIGQGGQGEVYKVNYNGEDKALKWYKKRALGKDPNAFYNNIKENIKRGAPSNEFLWPLDMTEWRDDTFGYVMDLKPDNYYEITEFMLGNVAFKSYKGIIDAALKIVSAFRILHNAGYSYQDINDGNFFINPNNGKVLICDNDNVAPDGTVTGILGKPRYMAPEIVQGKAKPDSLTDRFSLSIILYLLFCQNHPLEGRRYLSAGLTPELQEKLYGTEPLFIMDPKDDSNGPHPVLHANSISIWSCLPQYMRDIFIQAFSQEAFTNPHQRPKEIDWINVLTRFRSEIVRCSCGNEAFVEDIRNLVCDRCGKVLPVPYYLELEQYNVPALKGSRLYRVQIGICNETEALKPVATIVGKKDNPNVLGIRNLTDMTWAAKTPSGKVKSVEPMGIIPLKPGIEFKVYNQPIRIRKTRS